MKCKFTGIVVNICLLFSLNLYAQNPVQQNNPTTTPTSTTSTPPATNTSGQAATPATPAAPGAPAVTPAPAPTPAPAAAPQPQGETTNPSAEPALPPAPPQPKEELNRLQEGAQAQSIQDLSKIDCEYKPGDGKVAENVVEAWGKNAALQAFTFAPETLDTQLTKLKSCFTDEGWQSFQDALSESGNLDAIKNQKFTVKSTVQGNVNLSPLDENQWKITVPLTVTYQNDKDKIDQNLSVDLVIGRKTTGELGINQIIAAVKQN